jgi:hypothetical protein
MQHTPGEKPQRFGAPAATSVRDARPTPRTAQPLCRILDTIIYMTETIQDVMNLHQTAHDTEVPECEAFDM